MRISILVTEQSCNLIQHLLATQLLATQASATRHAFELGLKTCPPRPNGPRSQRLLSMRLLG